MGDGKIRAKRGVGFYAPRFSEKMFRFARAAGPLYTRLVEGIGKQYVYDMEPLYRAIHDFQSGKTRLIILFRHGSKADGPVVLSTVIRALPGWCKATGNRLPAKPHTHFLYGKDVLNWAGAIARWVFPGMGGIPVVNGRIEKESNSAIREILVNGEFPLAFAPEGQVTYHSFHTFALSQGSVRLAAWTHNDLRICGRNERVVILPVAISYRYPQKTGDVLDKLLNMLSAATAMDVDPALDAREYLLQVSDRLLSTLENAYGAAYPKIVDFAEPLPIQRRIDRLCDQILRCIESATGVQASGSILNRVFRVRYWIMDSLYREDVDPDSLSPAERGLADHRAQIAKKLDVHQQTVDILEYIYPEYIPPGCSTLRLVEYALNLLDVYNRICGGNVDSRYRPGTLQPCLVFGDSIDASSEFDTAEGTSRIATKRLEDRVACEFDRLVGDLETLMNSRE